MITVKKIVHCNMYKQMQIVEIWQEVLVFYIQQKEVQVLYDMYLTFQKI